MWCTRFCIKCEQLSKQREEFQSDFEEIVSYFKLDGHLIAVKRKKLEEKDLK